MQLVRENGDCCCSSALVGERVINRVQSFGNGAGRGRPALYLRNDSDVATTQRGSKGSGKRRAVGAMLQVRASRPQLGDAPARGGEDGVEGGLAHACVRVTFG